MTRVNGMTLYAGWWAVIPVLCGVWLLGKWLRRRIGRGA